MPPTTLTAGLTDTTPPTAQPWKLPRHTMGIGTADSPKQKEQYQTTAE